MPAAASADAAQHATSPAQELLTAPESAEVFTGAELDALCDPTDRTGAAGNLVDWAPG